MLSEVLFERSRTDEHLVDVAVRQKFRRCPVRRGEDPKPGVTLGWTARMVDALGSD